MDNFKNVKNVEFCVSLYFKKQAVSNVFIFSKNKCSLKNRR